MFTCIWDKTFVGNTTFSFNESNNTFMIDDEIVSKERYYEEYYKLIPKGSILIPSDL